MLQDMESDSRKSILKTAFFLSTIFHFIKIEKKRNKKTLEFSPVCISSDIPNMKNAQKRAERKISLNRFRKQKPLCTNRLNNLV